MRHLILAAVLLLGGNYSPGTAQTHSVPKTWEQWGGEPRALLGLLQDGYEIRVGMIGGDFEILYVQKGASAFRCLARLFDARVAPLITENPLLCYPLVAPARR